MTKTIADMTQQERDYINVLAQVIKILQNKCATVGDVAAEMGCTWEGAQRRILALKKRGCKLYSSVSKHGVAGAPPRVYKLTPNGASRKILDTARRVT